MRTFSLGVLVTSSLGDGGFDPGSLSTLASRIADLGADALFVATSATMAVEPVTVLAAIAGSDDLILGAVIALEESGRNPAIVAKLATTLALLSPGECALLFESEKQHDSSRLLEAVEVAVALRHEGPVTAGGAAYFVLDAYNEPRPPESDALAVGAIVDDINLRITAASDLVLVRVSELHHGFDDSKLIPLFHETTAVPISIASLVVQIDGNSIDHVAAVVSQLASRSL